MPVYAELDLQIQQHNKRQQTPDGIPTAERFKWRLNEEWLEGWDKQTCPELKPNTLIKHSYRLKYKIAQDITGEYWQAIDTIEDQRSPKRLVMLRFLNPKLNTHQRQLNNLRHDFHAYQQIRHPNFLNVYEMGHEGGQVFISFAWFQAETLRDLLNQNPTGIPLHGAQDIIESLAAVLEHSQKHISHLYLSPESIFYDPMRKITQVADCGLTPLLLACANQELGQSQNNRLAYTDCELLNGMSRANARSHVYTLSCLSYELLSGQHPYSGRNCLQAQEKQYQANTLANLSAKQWQILAQGLLFDNNKRLRSINKLYTGLYPKKTFTTALYSLLGISLIIGAGLIYLSKTHWYYQDIRTGIIAQQTPKINALESLKTDIQQKILQDDNSNIKDALTSYYIQHTGDKAIEKLEQYAPQVRNSLLYNPSVQKHLLNYYDQQIKQAIQQDQFEHAQQLAQSLQRHYPETSAWQTEISITLDQRINIIQSQYQTCLKADITLSDKTPCLRKNRHILSQINPQDPLLNPKPLADFYRKTCEKFMHQKAYAQAKIALDDWHSLLSQTPDPERERLSWLVTRHLDVQYHIKHQNFAKASALLQEAQTLYPARKDFQAYQKPLKKLQQQAISNLEKRYQIVLDQEQIIPLEQDQDIFDIRQELQAIDPQHPLLSDGKLHDLFFEKVTETAKDSENALTEVKTLIDTWLQLFQNQSKTNPLHKERFDHACNRVTLYYLQRAKKEQNSAYLSFALSLKPVPSVEKKLNDLLKKLQKPTPAAPKDPQ